MKNKYLLELIITCFIIIFINIAYSTSDDEVGYEVFPTGRFSKIEGEVYVIPQNSNNPIEATVNLVLQSGDRIFTEEHSRAEISFDKSIYLRIGENSEISFIKIEQSKENFYLILTLNSGSLYYRNLKTQPFKDNYIKIHTSAAFIETNVFSNFIIEIKEDRSLVAKLYRGNMTIESKNGKINLKNNQQIYVTADMEFGNVEYINSSIESNFEKWNRELDMDLITNTYKNSSDEENIENTQELREYGYWLYIPGYGRCWRPYVDYYWAPYFNGYWYWSDFYGWVWISLEPWGWFTYHYGFWFWYDPFGWVWLPGSYWSPAWCWWFYAYGYYWWIPWHPKDNYYEIIWRGKKPINFQLKRHFTRMVLPYSSSPTDPNSIKLAARFKYIGFNPDDFKLIKKPSKKIICSSKNLHKIYTFNNKKNKTNINHLYHKNLHNSFNKKENIEPKYFKIPKKNEKNMWKKPPIKNKFYRYVPEIPHNSLHKVLKNKSFISNFNKIFFNALKRNKSSFKILKNMFNSKILRQK